MERCSVCNNGIITISQGLQFFENIIKFWDEPQTFYKKDKDSPKGEFQDYAENFIKLIILNK